MSVSFFEANSLEPYKNRIKSYQNRIKIVSKAYQNRTQIASKPDQNHTKTIKYPRTSTKNLSLRCFCFFFEANSLEPYQNRIKIISKSYQNRIKIVSKPYQNHIEIITQIQSISNSYRQIVSKTILKSLKKNPEFSILEGFRCHKSRMFFALLGCDVNKKKCHYIRFRFG